MMIDELLRLCGEVRHEDEDIERTDGVGVSDHEPGYDERCLACRINKLVEASEYAGLWKTLRVAGLSVEVQDLPPVPRVL